VCHVHPCFALNNDVFFSRCIRRCRRKLFVDVVFNRNIWLIFSAPGAWPLAGVQTAWTATDSTGCSTTATERPTAARRTSSRTRTCAGTARRRRRAPRRRRRRTTPRPGPWATPPHPSSGNRFLSRIALWWPARWPTTAPTWGFLGWLASCSFWAWPVLDYGWATRTAIPTRRQDNSLSG